MCGLHIELNNYHRSYFAGQVVAGRVVVQNGQPDKVLEITISLEGTGQVHWKEKETYTEHSSFLCSNQTRTRVVTNAAEETYISYKRSLVGDGRSSITIPRGTSSYPFRFILPKSLPSSFTSKIGQVVYFLKAERKRSLLRFNNNEDHAWLPFTLNGLVDLNLESGASLPQKCQKRRGQSLCTFRAGHLSLALSISRSGFVAGEEIDFRALMSNTGNRKVTLAKASLQQISKFYAKGQCKILQKLISEARGPQIAEGEDEVWETNLSIPPIPPTKLGGSCGIIDVQYCLQVEMRIFGYRNPLVGMLPIIIGTIPLRATFGDFLRLSIPSKSGDGPIGPIANSCRRPSLVGIEITCAAPIPTPLLLSPTPSSMSSASQVPPPAYSEVVASAPLFSDYPDLPPPSYSEAVGVEGFTLNFGEGEKNSMQTPNSPCPSSTPSSDIFVPVYVTYKHKSQDPNCKTRKAKTRNRYSETSPFQI